MPSDRPTVIVGSPRASRSFVAACLVFALLLVAFPYEAVGEEARTAQGKVNRDLLAILDRAAAPFPEGACVRLQTRPEDAWTRGELLTLRFRTAGVMAVFYPGRYLEAPPSPGEPPAWRQGCVAVVEIEVRHGVAGSRPTFELSRAGLDTSPSPQS